VLTDPKVKEALKSLCYVCRQLVCMIDRLKNRVEKLEAAALRQERSRLRCKYSDRPDVVKLIDRPIKAQFKYNRS
jgi:hypothetical protein